MEMEFRGKGSIYFDHVKKWSHDGYFSVVFSFVDACSVDKHASESNTVLPVSRLISDR